ncbi:MAG: hypothetical protein LBE11_07740, partial [Prevotellaceae bacterium]|jgi:hypothetical protein|nr:hypothetical protein [Prevotellaceae bacterium]
LCIAKDDNVINVSTIFPPLDFAYIKDARTQLYWYAPEGYNPVLRPLSDLYRTITHKGEEIVPIVEMAQLIFPVKGTWRFENGHAAFRDNYDEPTRPGWRYEFYFLSGTFFLECFELNISKSSDPKELDYNMKIMEQYKLFDFMNELKIDYRGLIDAGLAIDYNKSNHNFYNE